MEAPKKVVIIDDDIDFINIYTQLLQLEGFEVFSSTGSSEGYQLILNVKPDLVILDIMMETPSSGFETAQRLRDNKICVPIIISSSIGKASSELYDTDYLNIKYVFQKQNDFTKLIELVRKYI
ncbi:MAG: response regulator [Candidatus Delongbacteria bacterium]|nr:response regulator [Candidatus Delongbacteria bacterium]MBN2836826.1 response regulator [Candidatus Delongbacteria bacterium]